MDISSLLNISQLSDELDSGEAIIKFLIKRFKKWIPGIDQNGQKLYSPDILITLIIILDKINNGILPSTIEEELKNNFIRVNYSNGKPSFQTNTNLHQRTVEALEKRNKIEILKVDALNKISDSIAHFEIFAQQNDKNIQNIETIKTDDFLNLNNAEDIIVPDIIESDSIDDLSMLIDENHSDIEKACNNSQEIEIDNLASLIEPEETIDIELDDLSKLIQDDQIDDLSLLIDNMPESNLDLDDLSLLLQDDNSSADQIDDLSILTNKQEFKSGTIDDLSALINFGPDKEITIPKPIFSPKDDFENYKSEIINIIIDLKTQGLNEEQTCEQFNQKGILTFSGKTNWSIKTIAQVYQLINNAA